MRFSVSRWLRPETSACPLCQKSVDTQLHNATVAVRHPEARKTLQQLCVTCRTAIPWIGAPVCRFCGRPEYCPDCPRRQEKHIRFCRSAVRYDTRMKDVLALYKYRGNERLEPVMSAMLASALERICAELGGRGQSLSFQAITSVPLAAERLDDRGFNQAERMASLLSQWYGIPYLPLLQRVRHTEKQSLKNRRNRLVDMQGNFLADVKNIESLRPEPQRRIRILLVDDIYTTGSTVNECARALKEAITGSTLGAEPEIYGVLWARS